VTTPTGDALTERFAHEMAGALRAGDVSSRELTAAHLDRAHLVAAQAQLAAARLQTNQLEVQAAGTGGDIRGAEADLSIARRGDHLAHCFDVARPHAARDGEVSVGEARRLGGRLDLVARRLAFVLVVGAIVDDVGDAHRL